MHADGNFCLLRRHDHDSADGVQLTDAHFFVNLRVHEHNGLFQFFSGFDDRHNAFQIGRIKGTDGDLVFFCIFQYIG